MINIQITDLVQPVEKPETYNIIDENNLLLSSMYCRKYVAQWELEHLSAKYPNKSLTLIRKKDNYEILHILQNNYITSKTLIMDTRELKMGIKAILKQHNYTHLIAVELADKLCYLNEAEVRALQVMVKNDPSIRENIKIYNGRTKRGSEIIDICKDGYLNNTFKPGFYDVCTKLSRELM